MATALSSVALCGWTRRAPVKCRSRGPTTMPAQGGASATTSLATMALNALFSYRPFFKLAAGRARKMIIERGSEIGFPWEPELAKLRCNDWDSELRAARDEALSYPEYYLKPFHAYEKGNLSWDAALEFELASKSVHANVFDPQRKKLDPDGDEKLRSSYHDKLMSLLKASPRSILDIGCATGLSTFGLLDAFPHADIVGVDMSPYFISVANYKLREASKTLSRSLPVQFVHAAGENTRLPSSSFDLVSLCLVCHELPRYATQQIIDEAARLLRTGGALAIMEMNPLSPSLQRMVNNIVAFTAFKSTEPYIDDYLTFGMEQAICRRGFTHPAQVESSPHHRTLVAFKK